MRLLSAFLFLLVLNTTGFPALEGPYRQQVQANAPRISHTATGIELSLDLPLPYGTAGTCFSDRNLLRFDGQFYRSETFTYALDTLLKKYCPQGGFCHNLAKAPEAL